MSFGGRNLILYTKGAKILIWQQLHFAIYKTEVILCIRYFPDFSAYSSIYQNSNFPFFDFTEISFIGNLPLLNENHFGIISEAKIYFGDQIQNWNNKIWNFATLNVDRKLENIETENLILSSSIVGSKSNFTATFNFSVGNPDKKLRIFTVDCIFAKKIEISALISAENVNATLYLGTKENSNKLTWKSSKIGFNGIISETAPNFIPNFAAGKSIIIALDGNFSSVFQYNLTVKLEIIQLIGPQMDIFSPFFREKPNKINTISAFYRKYSIEPFNFGNLKLPELIICVILIVLFLCGIWQCIFECDRNPNSSLEDSIVAENSLFTCLKLAFLLFFVIICLPFYIQLGYCSSQRASNDVLKSIYCFGFD